jgi:hypothetical protein
LSIQERGTTKATVSTTSRRRRLGNSRNLPTIGCGRADRWPESHPQIRGPVPHSFCRSMRWANSTARRPVPTISRFFHP